LMTMVERDNPMNTMNRYIYIVNKVVER
jgi:hypothetical protein